MNHLTELRLNLNGEEVALTNLEQRVFVHGDNGSGKTTVMMALSLLHGGPAYDFAGKDTMKDPATLRAMAADDTDSLWVVGVWADGTTGDWKLTLPTGRPSVSKQVPPAVFLYNEAEAALLGARARAGAVKFLYDWFVQSQDFAVVAQPDATAETLGLFAQIVQGLPANLPKKARLSEVYKIVERMKLEARAREKELATAMSVLQAYRGTQGQEVLSAMARLLQFQADNGLSKCGTCGQGTVTEARHAGVTTKLSAAGGTVGVTQEAISKISADLSQQSTHADQCDAAAGFALRWMQACVEKVLVRIEEQASRLLPDGLEVGLILKGTEFRLGYRKDGRVYIATSGAETMILLLAIAGAACPEALARGVTPILMLPDRKLSEPNVRRVMDIASNIDACVWLQELAKPRGRPRASWSYTDMDEVRPVTVLAGGAE